MLSDIELFDWDSFKSGKTAYMSTSMEDAKMFIDECESHDVPFSEMDDSKTLLWRSWSRNACVYVVADGAIRLMRDGDAFPAGLEEITL